MGRRYSSYLVFGISHSPRSSFFRGVFTSSSGRLPPPRNWTPRRRNASKTGRGARANKTHRPTTGRRKGAVNRRRQQTLRPVTIVSWRVKGCCCDRWGTGWPARDRLGVVAGRKTKKKNRIVNRRDPLLLRRRPTGRVLRTCTTAARQSSW